jgi:triosephosphate isomerase
MQRKKLLIANWKMNHSQASAREYFAEFFKQLKPGILGKEVEVRCAVPFTLLAPLRALLADSPCTLVAQNVHWVDKGAYTGEISLAMLDEIGIKSVLIGHSERRQYFGESDTTVALKTQAALGAGFSPVVCVGENLSERQGNETAAIIREQLRVGLQGIVAPGALIVAYEPVWAIGTGLAATLEQAQEVHALIREELVGLFGVNAAAGIPVLYGGSVTLANIGGLLAQRDIDGALVGGASLQGRSFAEMVNQMV